MQTTPHTRPSLVSFWSRPSFGSLLAACALAIAASAQAAPPEITVSDLAVRGEIEGENITFSLAFKADVARRGSRLPLVVGDVAYLDAKLPRKSKLIREGDRYVVEFGSSGKHAVQFRFASRPAKEREWRHTGFVIPAADIRKLSVVCDRDDLEIRFPGALKIQRAKNHNDKVEVTAFLGVAGKFDVQWKPEIKILDADLVVSAQANTIATASVGAMHLNSIYTYRVVQGALTELSFDLPAALNVTQVMGKDIQDWSVEGDEGETRMLRVTLSRPREGIYNLLVESEAGLPEFPTTIDLAVVTPRDVLRTSGFLMIGADSAIKLLVTKSLGLTQVDHAAFPKVTMDTTTQNGRALPSRHSFAYQYANMPYTLTLDADDIVPEFSADERLVLSLKDNALVLSASSEIDVRDAETRELVFETDSEWIVANVSGARVADYDVRDLDGKRLVQVYFDKAVLGRTLIDLRLEKALPDDVHDFKAPLFRLEGAQSERGHLVLATEKGLRLKAVKADGIREVHTGSTPMTVAGAQQAFRFKEAGWALQVEVQRTASSIHAETFHLVSIGEGVLYCGSTITYHIGGAPVREFRVIIPEPFQNVEFTGRDQRGWEQDGEVWTIALQEKVIGDYTLLVTYDQQYNYDGAEIEVGGVTTLGTESEVGYIALASAASLQFLEETFDTQVVIPIDPEEIPEEYELLISAPVLKAYKHVRAPHTATVKVVRYETEPLLNQIVDHATLTTSISPDGEVITTINYFIKNTSQQYLEMKLPEGATLWSTRLMNEAGQLQSVSALESGENILVPLHRPRDPNAAMKLEVVYAQSLSEPGTFGSHYKLTAPDLPGTHLISTTWDVTPPNDVTVTAVGGNMLTDYAVGAKGVRAVVQLMWRIVSVGLTELGGFFFCALIALGLAGLAAYSIGRKRGVIASTLASCIVLLGLAVIALPQAALAGITILKGASTAVLAPATAITFTKMVSLASGEDLTVKLALAPAWIGAAGSVWMLALAGLGGGAMLVASTRRRALTGAALGLTLICVALSQFAAGRALLVGVLLFIVAIVVLRLVARLIRRCHAAGVQAKQRAPAKPPRERRPRGAGKGSAGSLVEATTNPVATATSTPPAVPGAEPGSDDVGVWDLSEDDERSETPQGDPNAPDDGRDDGSRGGFSQVPVLGFIAATMLASALALAKDAPPPPKPPVMDLVEYHVKGPGTGRDEERSAEVRQTLAFTAEAAFSCTILGPGAVLTGYDLNSKRLALRSTAQGYVLSAERAGEYDVTLEYLLPVSEQDGRWALCLHMPENMRNKIELTLPEAGLDVRCDEAVLFKTWEEIDRTVATAVLGPAQAVHLNWLPRVRKTKLEKAVYFCEVNTFASFEPGVVDLMNLVRYQIAQGEITSMILTVPDGMSVTAVNAPGLSTWRFDPEQNQLEAVLDMPVSGEFTMQVMTQVATDGLPFDAEIGTLVIPGAARQRGSIALAAPGTVQIQVERLEGLNAMNVADFAPAAVAAAHAQNSGRAPSAVKRAFRYHKLPVSASVSAARVLPEVRVTEKATLSIADERIVLSTQLGITVSKAGIFSLYIRIPDDYDVETLSGEDVSHWDEVGDGDANLVVHFNKQVTGLRSLNLVIASMEKGIGDAITVPRVAVLGTRKLEGTLVISGERGVRLTPQDAEREGVSDLNPRVDLALEQHGLLAFKLLRPNWRVVLKADVQDAVVKPDVLHQVNLAEGMLQGRVYIRYRIENAGHKSFLLRAPEPGVVLSVLGRGIAKVTEIDKDEGIWQIDLHSKVENTYGLDVTYQIPFNPNSKRATIRPLSTVDTDPQKGYLVVMSGGRVQVQPEESNPIGLKAEESRSIPAAFGAGDLSDAILCYRTVRDDYALKLSVVRHESADVLPAKVNHVNLRSILSDRGQLLTRVEMNLNVGHLRFLKVTLPEKGDALWTAFVDGKVARPSLEGDAYRIPLDDTAPDAPVTVELTYASGTAHGHWSWRSQEYHGPRFNLPLNNLTWTLHVPPGVKYHGFDGTLELQDHQSPLSLAVFDEMGYLLSNRKLVEFNRARAKSDMIISEQYAQQGKQKLAKKVLEEAMHLAPNQADFEDARVQYRNLAKQQAVVGLVQRRNKMRWDNNIQDEQQIRQMRGFQDGNYTTDYAEDIESSLSEKENDALQLVADKFMDQQAAAAGVAQAIVVSMPEQGHLLTFFRPVQINPDADMLVQFKSSSGRLLAWLDTLWPVVILLLGWRILVGRMAPRRPVMA
ncbi:MAG: hypothetical protein O2923_12305 [Verrucomicrobia bacterium]|nr:hypothetical protein [Verrucomicrobiota bacterium]MDA1085391.1 hypothetical protein [Verrucomicrobiota bacterium]